MLVLICGDRDWKNRASIARAILGLPAGAEVIQGGCRGADVMARDSAKSLGMKVRTFEADWKKYGNSAGPRRNLKMLDEKPDLVIAFHPNLEKSKGTRHVVIEARRRGIEVRLITK